MLKSVLIFLFFAGVSRGTLGEDLSAPPPLKLSTSQLSSWKTTLLYNDGLFGSDIGLISSPDFYTDKNGRENPTAELGSFVGSLKNKSNSFENPHTICRFPRRALWIKEHLPDHYPKHLEGMICKGYNSFASSVPGRAASITYAAQFLGNPASFFGHNFLVLKRKDELDSSTLDMAVGFAANPEGAGALEYLVKGVTGGFRGHFTQDRYYVKIQEYNNFERRDIYEYPLKFSDEDMERLLATLFEIGLFQVDYYFFNVNCTTLILKIIDSAVDKNISQLKNRFYVSPVETISGLYQSGLVGEKFSYRPSSFSSLAHREKNANKTQEKLARKMLSDKTVTAEFEKAPVADQRPAIDLVLDYVDYKEKLAGAAAAKEYFSLRHQALLLRSKMGVGDESKPVSVTKPHLAHSNSFIEFKVGEHNRQQRVPTAGLVFRPVLHGLGEPSAGLSDEMSLSFLETTFQAATEDSEQKITRADIQFIGLETRTPITKTLNPLSYSFVMGNSLGNPLTSSNTSSVRTNWVKLASGYSLRTKFMDSIVSLMVDNNMSYNKSDDFSIHIGPAFSVLSRKGIYSQSFVLKRYFSGGKDMAVLPASISWKGTVALSRNFGLSAQLGGQADEHEINVGMFKYF
jgi:hypothetical protein